MKFDAAAITPGRANVCQNGTEPSAKSIQSVPLPEIPHVPASARCGVAAKAAQAASAMTSSLLIDPSVQGSSAGGIAPPAAALLVQRAVDLGDLLRLGRRPGLAVAARL